MWKGPSIIVKHVMGFKIGSYQLENEITPWTLLLDPPQKNSPPLVPNEILPLGLFVGFLFDFNLFNLYHAPHSNSGKE